MTHVRQIILFALLHATISGRAQETTLQYRGFLRSRFYENRIDNSYNFPGIENRNLTSTVDVYLKKNFDNFSFATDFEINHDHFNNDSKFTFNELFFSYYQSNLNLFVGRKLIDWSPGFTWNPSDKINKRKDPTDPTERRMGRDIIGAQYSLNTFNFMGIVQIDSNDVAFHLKIGKELEFLNASLYTFYSQKKSSDGEIDNYFGLIGKSMITNELDFYFETTIDKNQSKLIPQKTITPAGDIYFFNTDADLKKYHLSALAGLRYVRIKSDFNLMIEYYRNGYGYNKEERQNFFNYMSQINGKQDVPDTDLLYKTQFAAINYDNFMKDYLSFSANKMTKSRKFEYTMNCIWSIDDNSFILVPQIKYILSGKMAFDARFYSFIGTSETEFGSKPISNSLMLNMNYYF
jgi:hypothetical protein